MYSITKHLRDVLDEDLDKAQPWQLESKVLVCRALLRAPIVDDVKTNMCKRRHGKAGGLDSEPLLSHLHSDK